MDKVTKINLCNFAFTIENSAYSDLNSYIDSLKNHYKNHPDSTEIINDIEERIAELFLERCGEHRIVTTQMVSDIIEILGRPEALEDKGEEAVEENRDKNTSSAQKSRKLFRDISNKKIGGVCSGLAVYFNKDTTLIRAVFLLLAIFLSAPQIPIGGFGGGFILVIYIVLWFIVPPAKTIEDRCKMRGEENNIGSIEKKVKVKKEECQPSESNSNLWRDIASIVAKLLGLMFIIIGFVGILGFAISFFYVEFLHNHLINLVYSILSGQLLVYPILTKTLAALVCTIPFIFFTYIGFKLFIGFHSPKWRPALTLFILWLVSFIGLSVTGITTLSEVSNVEHIVSDNELELESDTLYICFSDIDKLRDEKIWVRGSVQRYDLSYFDFAKENQKIIQYPFISLQKEKYGGNSIKTNNNIIPNNMNISEIENIKENGYYSLRGDTLFLPPIEYSATAPLKEIYRSIEISVNDSVTVYIDKPFKHLFENNFKYKNIKY